MKNFAFLLAVLSMLVLPCSVFSQECTSEAGYNAIVKDDAFEGSHIVMVGPISFDAEGGTSFMVLLGRVDKDGKTMFGFNVGLPEGVNPVTSSVYLLFPGEQKAQELSCEDANGIVICPIEKKQMERLSDPKTLIRLRLDLDSYDGSLRQTTWVDCFLKTK